MSEGDRRIGYVIADYKTPHLTLQAIKSIGSFRPDSPVVVIDTFERKLGYSAALNLGIEQLPEDVEIVCCLNADVLMLQHDGAILTAFSTSPALGIVGPRQLDGYDRIAHGGIVSFEDGTDWDLDLRHRCWLWAWQPDTDADRLTEMTFAVPTVAGSILYARRSVLEEVGGWPEWTDFYYEDTYVCYRARHLGHQVIYTGQVTWRHYGQGSPVDDTWREMKMRQAQRKFVLECGRTGIPLRIWPEDDELAMALESGGT